MNPAQLTKANSTSRRFMPFRSFSTRLPDDKAKGSFFGGFLRSLSFRPGSTEHGSSVEHATPTPESRQAFTKSGSVNSYFSSRKRPLYSKSDPSTKDGPALTRSSTWKQVKRVSNRLVSPLRTMKDSYVECMTAAAGDSRFAGVAAMGSQGPSIAANYGGFAQIDFRYPHGDSEADMRVSDERLKAAIRHSKRFTEPTPEKIPETIPE